MLGIVDEHMVPRVIFWRSALGDKLISFIGTLESSIYVDYHTSIIKLFVMNHLTDRKVSISCDKDSLLMVYVIESKLL